MPPNAFSLLSLAVAVSLPTLAEANPIIDRLLAIEVDGCHVKLEGALPLREAGPDLYLFRKKVTGNPYNEPTDDGVPLGKFPRSPAADAKDRDVGSGIHSSMAAFSATDEVCSNGTFAYDAYWKGEEAPPQQHLPVSAAWRGWLSATLQRNVQVKNCPRNDCVAPTPPPAICVVVANSNSVVAGGEVEATYPYGKVLLGASKVRVDWVDGRAFLVGLEAGSALVEFLTQPPPGKSWSWIPTKPTCAEIHVHARPQTVEEKARWVSMFVQLEGEMNPFAPVTEEVVKVGETKVLASHADGFSSNGPYLKAKRDKLGQVAVTGTHKGLQGVSATVAGEVKFFLVEVR